MMAFCPAKRVQQRRLDEVQVDSEGFIFVPYAGRLRAAGNTPEQLRVLITNKLQEQTPDPQVEVRRAAGDGSTVSLTGTVAAPGVYPIERPTRSLLGMLSQAGGVSVASDIALVTLIRGRPKGHRLVRRLVPEPQTGRRLAWRRQHSGRRRQQVLHRPGRHWRPIPRGI